MDLDYFYAQVEEVSDPSLRNLPVVVCVFSGRTEVSGVVSTANYTARRFGIKSGIPITSAMSRLKETNAKFIAMDRVKYEACSNRVMGLLREEADSVEQTGIDEAFFDVTTKAKGDFGSAKDIASGIKRKILLHEGLTSSIGIGPNKIIAKLASDFEKPDGLTVVTPTHVRNFMDPLSVEKLYGIGKKSSSLLKERNILTIGDLARTDPSSLEELFGRKTAAYLSQAANGVYDQAVKERGEATQMSRIITLKKNSQDLEDILSQLIPTLDGLHRKIVERNLAFKSISVIGILTNLSIKTRTKRLERPTAELSAISESAPVLLASLIKDSGELRRVGIKVADFVESKEQSSLAEFLQ